MPFGLTPLQFAEIVLLTVGASLIIAGVACLSWRRRWGNVLGLPAPPKHSLEPTDVLIGLLAIWVLPSFFLEFFTPGGGPASTSQPASAPAGDTMPSPEQALAVALGQSSAAVVLLWLGKARIQGGLAGWGLRLHLIPRHVVGAAIAYVAIWPVCAGLLSLTRVVILLVDPTHPLPEHAALRTLQAEDVSLWIRAITVISAVALAPVAEELFFRGLLQPALTRWWRSQWLAVLFCGCAFGAFHFSVFDTVPALAFFGIVLGYAYARTHSLILVIVLHAVFNSKTILWIIIGDYTAFGCSG